MRSATRKIAFGLLSALAGSSCSQTLHRPACPDYLDLWAATASNWPTSCDARALDTAGSYKIEGPLGIGDPVHENLTERSLRQSKLLLQSEDYSSPQAWEYIRGVIWNDDPQILLLKRDDLDAQKFTWGVAWLRIFKDAEHRALAKEVFSVGAPLTARSHFGDLQFLHSMAAADGERPIDTQRAVMRWAEFAYRTAIGEIESDSFLSAVPVAGIPELFADRHMTVGELFGAERVGDLRRRAMGSLLHVIQDSYAAGHTDRQDRPDRRRGNIRCFYSYAQQNHAKHAADDGWQGSGAVSARLAKMKGAQDAIEVGAALLSRYRTSPPAPWPDVQNYLLSGPFALAADARPSEAGATYKSSM